MNDDYLPTRHSLLKRLKDWQDDTSWQLFFDTYWKFIYGVAQKSGLSDAEAQDVVQETVVTVAKRINDFKVGKEHGSFKAWLVRTTKWRITDQFRKRGRLMQSGGQSSDDSGTAPMERVADNSVAELDAALEQDWEQNLLEVALEKLKASANAEEFQIFCLHVIKGWKAKKVAETVGAKLPAVYFAKYKLTRVIKREVERLKREVI